MGKINHREAGGSSHENQDANCFANIGVDE